MILHDFSCNKCHRVFERMVNWDEETSPCQCGAQAARVFISHRKAMAQSFDPVLVYRDRSGHYRFPGRNQGKVPAGYEAVYLRTTSQVRKFERQMNKAERERYMDHKERAEAAFAPFLKQSRSELRQKMQSMSEYGRSIAEAAMRTHDSESSVNYGFDAAFRLEAFSQDASNRERHYDRDMRGRK